MATNPQAIIDAIDAAILAMTADGGPQTVSWEGRSVTYQSMESLLAARARFSMLANTAARGLRINSIQFGGSQSGEGAPTYPY